MDRYLLDTNIVSFFVRGRHPSIDHRIRTSARGSLAISTVVEAEIRFGLALLPVKTHIAFTAEDFLRTIDIHAWDSACASSYASLNARQQRLGKVVATIDTMIAAHALAHDFILVSNDAAFHQIKGLKLEDWTKGPQRT